MQQEQEIVETDERSVSCDGNGSALGHPMIYLRIAPGKTSVICPYCSRKFILKEK